jgi:hypothetical protein
MIRRYLDLGFHRLPARIESGALDGADDRGRVGLDWDRVAVEILGVINGNWNPVPFAGGLLEHVGGPINWPEASIVDSFDHHHDRRFQESVFFSPGMLDANLNRSSVHIDFPPPSLLM